MSIIKTVVLLALVVASVSGLSGGRRQQQRQRGRGFHQRGREMEVAAAGAGPAAEESHAIIGDALAGATEEKEVLANPETLSAPEAAQASEALQEHLTEAIAVAAEAPQAQEVQAEVVKEKVQDTHDDLEKNLKAAKRHQKALKKYGDSMSPEEAVEHHKALQKYLELALHAAEQHNIAVQEDKAIEAGATPVEVAEIAPIVISGRRGVRG